MPIQISCTPSCTKANRDECQAQKEKKNYQSVHISLNGGFLIHHYNMEVDEIDGLHITFGHLTKHDHIKWKGNIHIREKQIWCSLEPHTKSKSLFSYEKQLDPHPKKDLFLLMGHNGRKYITETSCSKLTKQTHKKKTR